MRAKSIRKHGENKWSMKGSLKDIKKKRVPPSGLPKLKNFVSKKFAFISSLMVTNKKLIYVNMQFSTRVNGNAVPKEKLPFWPFASFSFLTS